MNEIKNYDVYCERMNRAMLDKLFFVDKIFEPVDFLLDFGCADGTLLKAIKPYFPNCDCIGYDLNENMIALASRNCSGMTFNSKWDNLSFKPEKTLLNLSSVIHEVYSYGNENDINEFWARIFKSGFKYISIRDMAISNKDIYTVNEKDINVVRKLKQMQANDFETIWGPIKTNKELIHFLLKYKYVENWEREVKENYLPISLEELFEKIPENYKIIFQEHRILPYTADEIKRNFNINVTTPTHIKLLLRRIL